jgi:hypothetical protein
MGLFRFALRRIKKFLESRMKQSFDHELSRAIDAVIFLSDYFDQGGRSLTSMGGCPNHPLARTPLGGEDETESS